MPPKISLEAKLAELHAFILAHVLLLSSRSGESVQGRLRQLYSKEEKYCHNKKHHDAGDCVVVLRKALVLLPLRNATPTFQHRTNTPTWVLTNPTATPNRAQAQAKSRETTLVVTPLVVMLAVLETAG